MELENRDHKIILDQRYEKHEIEAHETMNTILYDQKLVEFNSRSMYQRRPQRDRETIRDQRYEKHETATHGAMYTTRPNTCRI